MEIVIFDVGVKQDKNGRYCLNDLHKAAGGERRNDPHDWLRLKQTIELVQELSDTGNPVTTIRGGKVQGTYVCKELVYAYAMWINAKFHLQVIRTFDGVAEAAQKKYYDRLSSRVEYFPMNKALEDERACHGKGTKGHHFSNEADMLNGYVIGMKSSKYKEINGLPEKCEIRDHFTPAELACMVELQRINMALINLGWDYYRRKQEIGDVFARRFQQGIAQERLKLSR